MDSIENKWAPLEVEAGSSEKIWTKSRSFGQDTWFRFRKKTAALISLCVLVLIVLFAVIGPNFTSYSYSAQRLEVANISPRLTITVLDEYDNYFYITQGMKLIEVSPEGELVRQIPKIADDYGAKVTTFDYGDGKVITLDYSEMPIALQNSGGDRVLTSKTVWNKSYVLGTDHLGRDILTRLMYGCRISMLIAFVATLVNLITGTIYGGLSGYFGGRIDSIMMRIVDIISTIPLTLYVILIKVALNNSGLSSMIIALTSVYWVVMARVVRGQVLSLKAQEFVTASRTVGTGAGEILMRHLVPNAMGPILVTATMQIPSAIFTEAFMSYIGIGIAPPMASLGTMCNDATEALRSNPYQLFIPALMICILMLAFNFLGDGLRDALDPKLKK